MAPTFISKIQILAAGLLLSAPLTNAVPYALSQSYSGAGFFNNFDFITSDPSGGWVTYLDQATAQGLGYASASANGAYMGVDSTSYLDPSGAGAGRRSVRIESKESFNQGLFIGDFSHMPAGCGVWPSWWMYGPNWPYNGELGLSIDLMTASTLLTPSPDIIEGVNQQATNRVSGHTSPGCVISGTNSNAQFISNNCYDPVQNSGCSFSARGVYSYGQNFNSVGGGVYAMQWTAQWISVWFFKRGSIPANIQNQNPDPGTWGTPMAFFGGNDANIAQRFANMKIVLNTDFCGPWASNVWDGCPGSSCVNYVASNPGAFASAYWGINSINIYQPTGPLPYNHMVANATMSDNDTDTSFGMSSATPLASKTSVYLPNDAMGATVTPIIGPSPTTTSSLVTSLPLRTSSVFVA